MTRMKGKGIGRTVVCATFLFLVGAGLVLYPSATDIEYQFRQWRMSVAQAQEPAAATGIALPDGAVAKIEIPEIGVDAFVVEGTDDESLVKGPGHYPGTPLPGTPGNAAIAGHRTMYGHVFHDLHELEPGDEIVTYTSTTTATYRVVEIVIVDPSQVDVVAPVDGSRLTLTTCHPIGSAAQRLVVVAELAG